MSREARKQAENFCLGAFERNLTLIFDQMIGVFDPFKSAPPDSGRGMSARA